MKESREEEHDTDSWCPKQTGYSCHCKWWAPDLWRPKTECFSIALLPSSHTFSALDYSLIPSGCQALSHFLHVYMHISSLFHWKHPILKGDECTCSVHSYCPIFSWLSCLSLAHYCCYSSLLMSPFPLWLWSVEKKSPLPVHVRTTFVTFPEVPPGQRFLCWQPNTFSVPRYIFHTWS